MSDGTDKFQHAAPSGAGKWRVPVLGRLFRRAPLVTLLRLGGVIGALGPLRSGLTLANLAEPIERAFKPSRLAAVALVVNSPGGSPVQSDLIAQRIRDLAEEKKVPVYAFCEDVAASGGYWLASAADEILARETSIVGSIGVVSAGFGFPALLERVGVERRVYTSGDKKALLDPFRPEKEEDIAHLKTIQREIHERFKHQVRSRRGSRLAASDEELFSGAFWTGAKAKELGLVDAIGEPRRTLRERYGKKVQFRLYGVQRSWWRRRLGGSVEPAPPADWAASLLSAVEERALWSRYGL
ncbi:MAG: S49 family peptidase [Kiloniellales bacterium]